MATAAEWLTHLMRVVPEEAPRYAEAFSKNYLPVTKDSPVLASVKDYHLKEMGVAVGHRVLILNLFAELRRGDERRVGGAGLLALREAANQAVSKPAEEEAAAFSETEQHPHAVITTAVQVVSALTALQGEVRRNAQEDTNNYFAKPRTERSFGSLKWVALFGERESEAALMTEAKGLRDEFGFPLQFIERAFKDDGPMPFFLHEGQFSVLLMRIPEEGSDAGTTIKTITNRVVLLFRDAGNGELPVIVTYHRYKNEAFQQMHSLWATTIKVNASSVSAVGKEFLKRLLNLYRESISVLDARSEEAEADPQPEICIEKLSLIQKQSSVYARCLQSFADVMKTTGDFADFGDFADEICELAAGLTAKAMELTENANTTINLKMALDAYRSGVNMKYFTYLSIVCQPIAVATGWFGMNWSNMPELAYEDSYFIFCGCMLALLIGISFSIWWFFERPRPTIALSSQNQE